MSETTWSLLILAAIVIGAFYLIWRLGQGPMLSGPRTLPKRVLAFVLGTILIGVAIFLLTIPGAKLTFTLAFLVAGGGLIGFYTFDLSKYLN